MGLFIGSVTYSEPKAKTPNTSLCRASQKGGRAPKRLTPTLIILSPGGIGFDYGFDFLIPAIPVLSLYLRKIMIYLIDLIDLLDLIAVFG